MPPPSKNSKLRTIHQANEDLENIIRIHKELTRRLETLAERGLSLRKTSGVLLDDQTKKVIRWHLSNRRYEEAGKLLDALERRLGEAERRIGSYRDFMKEFDPLLVRWRKMVSEGVIEDDKALIDKVVEDINDNRLAEAEKTLSVIRGRMDPAQEKRRKQRDLKDLCDKLLSEIQSLYDDGVLLNRNILDKSRIDSLLREDRTSELEDLLARKRGELEKIKAEYDEATDLYEEIDGSIKDFTPNGRLKIPSIFRKGLKDYEDCIYSEAIKSFKQAKTRIGSLIENASVKLTVKMENAPEDLKVRRWEEMELIVRNDGDIHLADIAVRAVSDNIKMDLDDDEISVKAGKEKKVPIRINFLEEGLVPIKIAISYTDPLKGEMVEIERKFRFDVTASERGSKRATRPGESGTKHESIKKAVQELYKDKEEIRFKSGDFYSYRILDKLGSGGFSTIYRVESGDEVFAMKTPKDIGMDLDETIEINERDIQKFRREASIWAKLTDILPDDVVRLVDVGLQPFPWFVMELASHSLRDVLKDATYDERIEITLDVLSKFDRIHHQGIVHRDIKPENILFIDDELKITDFGISKLVNSTTRSTLGVSGTCYYMSPEQIQKSRFGGVDWRTDIWQLGVLIYEIFTSRFPFDSESPYEITSNIMHEEPALISDYLEELEPLDNVLLKALRKEKKRRWQSALELKLAIVKELDL